jgi:hypothetical protein
MCLNTSYQGKNNLDFQRFKSKPDRHSLDPNAAYMWVLDYDFKVKIFQISG